MSYYRAFIIVATAFHMSVAYAAPEKTAMANPASVNCVEKGGKLKITKRPDGGEYGICLFEDNRQCEEWALFRGLCPQGGVKVTGYNTDADIFCAITGGQPEGALCRFANGADCSIQSYFAGDCRPRLKDWDGNWVYKQFQEAGIQIGYPSRDVRLEGKIGPQLLSIKAYAVKPDGSTLAGDMQEAVVAVSSGAAAVRTAVPLGGDFPVCGGKAVAYMTLGRGGCDSVFERTMVFRRNGYVISVTLSADREKMIKDNPSFFSDDSACSWTGGGKNAFASAAGGGKLQGIAVDWASVFDGIKDAVLCR